MSAPPQIRRATSAELEEIQRLRVRAWSDLGLKFPDRHDERLGDAVDMMPDTVQLVAESGTQGIVGAVRVGLHRDVSTSGLPEAFVLRGVAAFSARRDDAGSAGGRVRVLAGREQARRGQDRFRVAHRGAARDVSVCGRGRAGRGLDILVRCASRPASCR